MTEEELRAAVPYTAPARHHWLAFALLALTGATVVLMAVPRRMGEQPGSARDRVLRLLEFAVDDASDESVLRDLADLGASAVRPAVAVLAGHAPELERDPERRARVEARRALLWPALEAWPTDAVVAAASELASGSIDDALLAARILGRVGSEEGVRALMRILTGVDGLQAARTRVQREVEEAIGSLVARESSTPWLIAESITEVPRALWPAVARGVGRSLRQGGVSLLQNMLGRTLELDLVILTELGRVDPRDRQAVREGLFELLSTRLGDPQPRVRKHAALALGRLHDFRSAEGLTAALSDSEPSVARAALHALQSLSGMGWPAESGRWIEWRRREALWLESALPGLERDVGAADPGRAAGALRELAHHAHLRDEIAMPVISGLRHAEAPVVALACSVAAAARIDGALAELVALLENVDPSVRRAAHSALTSIGGAGGPEELSWWRAWLHG